MGGRFQNSFKAQEQEACSEFDRRLVEDVAFMHQVLEDNLQDISWPRETLISFEIADTAASAKIDVDLPEIEDMPRRVAKLPDSGYKLNIKELSARAVAELYSRHVHSVGFRVLGEAFATLPTVQEATLSGFTQRSDLATGKVVDTYYL